MVIRGSRDSNGSWKMICMSRRRGLSSESLSLEKVIPLKNIDPSVGCTRRRSRRPVVVIPLPLSPAKPTISPFFTEKEIPSTALTVITSLETKASRKPFLRAKCFFSLSTWITVSSLTFHPPRRDDKRRDVLPSRIAAVEERLYDRCP